MFEVVRSDLPCLPVGAHVEGTLDDLGGQLSRPNVAVRCRHGDWIYRTSMVQVRPLTRAAREMLEAYP